MVCTTIRPPPSGVAAEIDFLDRGRAPGRGGSRLCGGRRRRRRGRGHRAAAHGYKDRVALSTNVIGLHAVEVEDEPRAARGLGGDDRVDTARLDVDAARFERERGARQVDGQPRGIVDGEGHRRRGRAIQHEAHLDLFAGLRMQLDFLEAARRLRPRGLRGQREHSCQRRERYAAPSASRLGPARGGGWGATMQRSCSDLLADHSLNAIAAGRSMKPPMPSVTISMSEIFPSSMAVIRPSLWPTRLPGRTRCTSPSCVWIRP